MKEPIDWDTHIESWKESGLSKAEYCRQHNLNKYTFYHRTNKSIRRPEPGLVELPFPFHAPEKERTALFEFHLEFPFHLRLKLNLDFGKVP